MAIFIKAVVYLVCMLILSKIFFSFLGRWVKRKWVKEFPLTFLEYIEANPETKTQSGIKCNICGSKSLKNWGMGGAQSKNRSISCNHCSTKLYRIES
jgi:DNA-directed RNA polymerase subunit RPC12/RpoP